MQQEICPPGMSPAGGGAGPGSYSEADKIFYMSLKTKNFELIELAIPALQPVGKVPFPDIPQLRNMTIKAIEAWSVASITTSPNGLPVITAADTQKSYIGLFVNGKDSIVRLPLVVLNRMNLTTGATVSNLAEFDNLLGVDWSKSYIQFATAPAVTAFAVLIGVHYV